jgi:hypothetical protein
MTVTGARGDSAGIVLIADHFGPGSRVTVRPLGDGEGIPFFRFLADTFDGCG